MTLVIDNYDSFTFNLKQALEGLGAHCEVRRNDELTLKDIETLRPERIVISPGPGRPDEAGITLELIKRFSKSLPILGVCLGHQALGQAFGGQVIRAKRPFHGKVSKIRHHGEGLFKGTEAPFSAARYHSLVVERKTLPDCFAVDAESDEGEVMAIRHREYPLYGVQFHPESIATPEGSRILANFIQVGS